MRALEQCLELAARVRIAAEEVRDADRQAHVARAELGRCIERARSFGIPMSLLAEIAGMARVTGYRLMSMAAKDGCNAGCAPSRPAGEQPPGRWLDYRHVPST